MNSISTPATKRPLNTPLTLTLPQAAFIAKATDLVQYAPHVLSGGGDLLPLCNVEQVIMAGAYQRGHADFRLIYEYAELAAKIVHDDVRAMSYDRTYVYLVRPFVTETLLIANMGAPLDPPRVLVEHIYPDVYALHQAIANALYRDELIGTTWGDLFAEHREYLGGQIPGILRASNYARMNIHIFDAAASIYDDAPEPPEYPEPEAKED